MSLPFLHVKLRHVDSAPLRRLLLCHKEANKLGVVDSAIIAQTLQLELQPHHLGICEKVWHLSLEYIHQVVGLNETRLSLIEASKGLLEFIQVYILGRLP